MGGVIPCPSRRCRDEWGTQGVVISGMGGPPAPKKQVTIGKLSPEGDAVREPALGFWLHLEKPVPDILWHYTSLESLMKIATSWSMLASDLRYMNDTKELIHARDQMLDRIHELIEQGRWDKNAQLAAFAGHLKRPNPDPVFVASFSEKPDDLSQWRGYTPAGQGVCLGINTAALKLVLDRIRERRHKYERVTTLGKVIYLADGTGASFDEFLIDACKYVDVINGEVVRSVALERLINAALPFYKHDAFRDEAEWRVRISANSTFIHDPLDVEFRVGRSMLIPAYRLDFKGVEPPFIHEVVVGPTPNMKNSVASIRGYLNSSGFSAIKVRPSRVPYRTW